MLSNAQLKAVLVANLTDDRIFAIQMFLTKLILRKNAPLGISPYRIQLTTTDPDTYITSLDEFIAAIDENSFDADYDRYAESMGGDRVHPFTITLTNFTVKVLDYIPEDGIYATSSSDKGLKIRFSLNYLSDADSVLPIKIFDVRLVS